MLASILVIGFALTQPVRRQLSRIFGFLLLAFLGIFFIHFLGATPAEEFEKGGVWVASKMASAWISQSVIILTAAALISERGKFVWILRAVLGCGILQVLIMVLQAFNISVPWPSAGPGPCGTLVKRAALSIFLGSVSIWTTGKKAWFFAIASAISGSFAGSIPAFFRLLYRHLANPMVLAMSLPIALLLGSFSYTRVSDRVDVWGNAVSFFSQSWLTGRGFFPLPGSFREDGGGTGFGLALFSDYHSTWLDWIVRTGLIGILILGAGLFWMFSQVKDGASWRKWSFLMFLWAGTFQSAEAFPVMILLALCFMIGLNYQKGSGNVSKV